MRRKHIYIIGFVAVLTAFSCAKERGPHLTVFVHESNGTPAVGATVHAWPGNDQPIGGSGIVDEEMDQVATTDASGYANFDFKASAVLDVDVLYYKNGASSTVDTLSGSMVTKIESKRQRSEENNYSETVEVK